LIRSPGGGSILFARNIDGDPTLFVAKPSGANAVRLTPPDIHPTLDVSGGAAFTPDGRNIAFTSIESCKPPSWRCAHYKLYVVGRDGSGLRLIATEARQPSWAPDGRRLAYTGLEGVYVADTQAGQTTYVAKGLRPIWASRGELIAYNATVAGYGVACFVSADGSGRRCTQGHSLTSLLWSPDATRVAFRQANPPQVGTIDATARRIRYLPGHGGGRPVAWSPNGKRIAVSYGVGNSYYSYVDVVTIAKPRGSLRVVDEPGSYLSDFRWHGSRISYVAGRPDG
jgi:Tol biopolymer transport system component